MKFEIVADGFKRLRRVQKALASGPLERRYATELAGLTTAEKQRIGQLIAEESRSREKMMRHKPSPKALW